MYNTQLVQTNATIRLTSEYMQLLGMDRYPSTNVQGTSWINELHYLSWDSGAR